MRQTFLRVYRDRSGEWRWRLVARNGRIVGDSAEGYSRKSNAVRAALRLMGATVLLEVQA